MTTEKAQKCFTLPTGQTCRQAGLRLALCCRVCQQEAKVEAAAEAMRTSRLAWGLHSDLMCDAERSRAFWAEAATVALTAVGVIPPGGESRGLSARG